MLLGAGVRTLNAGLTCPDWPLCFGQMIPHYHLGVYLEFIHRAVAGVVALIFIFCFLVALIKPSLRAVRFYMWLGLFFLVSQIIMGGLTVLKLLEPGIVTLHLSLALAFLSTIVMAQGQLQHRRWLPQKTTFFYRLLAIVSLVFTFAQIFLGGRVATTYAGSVCLDFPTCAGQWFPTFEGAIGLQVMHRLGAYTVATLVMLLFFMTLRLSHQRKVDFDIKILSAKSFLLVLSQIAVGVINLKLQLPPWLTVIHLGLAALIFLSLLKINQRLWN